MTYNELLIEAENIGIEVFENQNIGRLKGICINNTISLSKNIKNIKEKKCIIAEEIGHYKTTYGNILNQNDLQNVKEENKGKAWAYKKLVGFDNLIKAYKEGIKNRYELSIFLEVTEKFLLNAITYYKNKYGFYYEYNSYLIYFDPLGVVEKY